jgi:CYTH domain-containing protein
MEIERKFLVTGDYKAQAFDNEHIAQGYLCTVPQRTVRVRIKGNRGFLTVKGASDASGTTRFEWETSVALDDARALLTLCEVDTIVEKTRYYVRSGQHVVEVDEFEGRNAGLTVAEIELSHPDESYVRPDFLGEEVTGDARYYNAYLSQHPYTTW